MSAGVTICRSVPYSGWYGWTVSHPAAGSLKGETVGRWARRKKIKAATRRLLIAADVLSALDGAIAKKVRDEMGPSSRFFLLQERLNATQIDFLTHCTTAGLHKKAK